jgi:hypothetical protein
MTCAICKKPMGHEATLRGKNACKKHKHILLTHLDEEATGAVRNVSYFDQMGEERPVHNLGDYEKAVTTGLFIVFRD